MHLEYYTNDNFFSEKDKIKISESPFLSCIKFGKLFVIMCIWLQYHLTSLECIYIYIYISVVDTTMSKNSKLPKSPA